MRCSGFLLWRIADIQHNAFRACSRSAVLAGCGCSGCWLFVAPPFQPAPPIAPPRGAVGDAGCRARFFADFLLGRHCGRAARRSVARRGEHPASAQSADLPAREAIANHSAPAATPSNLPRAKTKARAEHGLGIALASQQPHDHWLAEANCLLGSSFLGSGSSVRSGISSSLGSVSSSGAGILGSVLGGVSSIACSVSSSSASVLGGVSSSGASILGSVSSVGSSSASSVGGVLGSIGSGVGSVLSGFNSRCGCRSGSFHRSGCWCRSSSFFLLAAGGQSNSGDQRSENNGLLHLDIPNDGGFLCFKPEANDSPPAESTQHSVFNARDSTSNYREYPDFVCKPVSPLLLPARNELPKQTDLD